LAALDCDWSEFTPAEQAAFALARRVTHEPYALTAADLERVRKHFSDVQVLEIVFTVANNNATNRWTGGLEIPEEDDGSFFARGKDKQPAVLRTFLTPTSERYKQRPSQTIYLPKPGQPARPLRESRTEVESALAAARTRTPRLPLVADETARTLLPADWPAGPLPQWVQLLANFPKAGPARALSLRAAEEKGSLDRRLKAQVAWIAAREDRAWYALGQARQRLLAQGFSNDAIFALDGSWDSYPAGTRAAFYLARKLTATPDQVVDADVAEARKHFSDKEVAELVHLIGAAAFFDRLTEAAALQLEK
jgi:alkylhydroperoxidase family enzyme